MRKRLGRLFLSRNTLEWQGATVSDIGKTSLNRGKEQAASASKKTKAKPAVKSVMAKETQRSILPHILAVIQRL